MILQRIAQMLLSCESDAPRLPPTHLYNENWLLRLILDWFSRNPEREPTELAPLPHANWFAEAWLPSAFLPRHRRDPLAESWTHADGAIGHFTTGNRGWSDLVLLPEARQLTIVEGKIFSRFSSGVKNAPWYDQAARTVACMAEILRRAGRHPIELEQLSYIVIAPRRRVEESVFADEMTRNSMIRKARRRVDDYAGARDDWFNTWFVPTIRRVSLHCLSWEDVLEAISFHDRSSGQELDSFYGRCLYYNRPQSVTLWHDLRSGPPAQAEPELVRLAELEPTSSEPKELQDSLREKAIRRKG